MENNRNLLSTTGGRLAFFLLMSIIAVLVVIMAVLGKQSVLQVRENLDQTEIENTTDNKVSLSTKLGISGFFPANFPEHSKSNLENFWVLMDRYTTTHGVHIDWKDTRLLDVTAENYNGEIVLVLGFQNPEEWLNDKGAFIVKIKDILKLYPDINYVGIGNEVNLLAESFPGQFSNFVSAYKDIYSELKEEYPNKIFFPTWQYERLIGAGYLMTGKKESKDQWEVVRQFDGVYDIFAITTYPYFDFTNPADVPENYLKPVLDNADVQLAITETGWMSRWEFGGDLRPLTLQGYTGSELEQDRYLAWLLQRVYALDTEFEFVNWVGLHDFSNWREGDMPERQGLFDSIAFHYNDGTSKLAWLRWIDIFSN